MSITKTKQPAERLDYDFDYSLWLNPDDEVISAVFVMEYLGEGTPLIPLVIDSEVVAATFTKAWVLGGTHGEVYKLTCTATTSRGRVKQYEIKIRLKDN